MGGLQRSVSAAASPVWGSPLITEMQRSPRHHTRRRRRLPSRIAPFLAGFALCYLIFGGGDDGEAARAEIAREKAEAAARHAENAATAAEIAERATRGEVRGGDPYACPVRVPSSMRYWTKPVVEQPGDAPAYDVEAYLTFVPDFGGLNNVRISLENVLSLARASGRTLVLPPVQPYYLLNACKKGCEYSLADFFPALLENQDRAKVVTSAAFFLEILPRLAKSGRLLAVWKSKFAAPSVGSSHLHIGYLKMPGRPTLKF